MFRHALCLYLFALVGARAAEAFCGFYVSGGDAKLFNNATQVVLMREGTRTVLSMQNSYQGPPENFALVIPVPVVLQKENVKTLAKDVFEKVDKLGAPRLVEYWEQDPCFVPRPYDRPMSSAVRKSAPMSEARPARGEDLGVTVEARFSVGEYEIVILSAKDALGLDTWLRQTGYKIPENAAPFFKSYVQSGSKFFVAKVNVEKVTFHDGRAILSPLRFHYDSEKFSLPIRLGLINAKDSQDLIVSILARGQRYEVANYANVTIPTNLDLKEEAKSQFGAFYTSLFDLTLEKNPKAVVTEYAWDSASCDPCPTPPLHGGDLVTLGLDALPGSKTYIEPQIEVKNMAQLSVEQQSMLSSVIENTKTQMRSMHQQRAQFGGNQFVLTRLHARYNKETLGEDLVFRAAAPIAGGREFMKNGTELEQGFAPYSVNNFQGRYAIRYPWTGAIACESPRRGIWGGPPQGSRSAPIVMRDGAMENRSKALAPALAESPVPELGIKGEKSRAGIPGNVSAARRTKSEDKVKGFLK